MVPDYAMIGARARCAVRADPQGFSLSLEFANFAEVLLDMLVVGCPRMNFRLVS